MLLEIFSPGEIFILSARYSTDSTPSLLILSPIMHLIRRAAFRVAGASSTSFSSAPRSLSTTSSSILARSKIQSRISPAVFRRFNSDDARPIESADGQEDSTVRSAIESSESTHASNERPYAPRNSFRNSPDRFIVNPGPTVYIGNLLFEVSPADLEKEFEQFGTVKSARVITDERGMSKGFAYVEFENTEQAKAAIDAKHETMFEGRQIIVNYSAQSSRNRPKNPESKTLFVGNLAFEMSDADLNKLFRDIRHVLDVRVAIDRRTGQPRGFAHADFVDVESAVAAKEVLNGREVYGRKLRVDYSSFKPATNKRFQREDTESAEGGNEGTSGF